MKKIILLTTILMTPCLLYADASASSASLFYFALYICTVIPILIWIINVIVFFVTWRGKMIDSGSFWFMTVPNFLLSLFSFVIVCWDLLENHKDSATFLVFLTLVLIPLSLSFGSIYLRKRMKKVNKTENNN